MVETSAQCPRGPSGGFRRKVPKKVVGRSRLFILAQDTKLMTLDVSSADSTLQYIKIDSVQG